MIVWIRPGPPAIAPGSCPGGVVLHIYAATRPPSLIVERCYPVDVDLGAAAAIDAALVDAMGYDAVCFVGYDGDTGGRYTADEWMSR